MTRAGSVSVDIVMAALDAAIQQKKLQYSNVLLNVRVKPGHDGGASNKTANRSSGRLNRLKS
jgi:hypothetical protein